MKLPNINGFIVLSGHVRPTGPRMSLESMWTQSWQRVPRSGHWLGTCNATIPLTRLQRRSLAWLPTPNNDYISIYCNLWSQVETSQCAHMVIWNKKYHSLYWWLYRLCNPSTLMFSQNQSASSQGCFHAEFWSHYLGLRVQQVVWPCGCWWKGWLQWSIVFQQIMNVHQFLVHQKKMWEPWAKPCINPRWSKKADLIMKESTFVCLGSNPVEHVYKFNLYWFIFSCMFHPQPILWYSLCRRCTKIAQTEAKIRPGAQDRLATASQPSWWCRMMSSWWCRQS